MVRIKHRYLVVQILSPTLLKPSTSTSLQTASSQLLTPKLHGSHTSDTLLALHAPTPDSVDIRTLIRTVRASISLLFGDYGAATAGGDGLKMMYWSNATSTFVLRCRREMFRILWAALTFVRTVPGLSGTGLKDAGAGKEDREVVLRVVRVSGTVKKALEEVVRSNRLMMGRLRGMEASVDGLERGVGSRAQMELQDVLGMERGRVTAGVVDGEEDGFDAGDVVDDDDDMEDESDGGKVSDSDNG